MPPKSVNYNRIRALKVKQWLNVWDKVRWNPEASQRKPPDTFLMFAMSADRLRRLCGIHRRSTSTMTARAQDLNIQRRHDEDRSSQIRDFVEFGFPWCSLSPARRKEGSFMDLRKPGWLPTAIVVNILKPGETRNGITLAKDEAIEVAPTDFGADLILPATPVKARPTALNPIEVIDGQHRLWAFDNAVDGDFELPVVAFHGLDRSWQAYLFWSINITPKKIKASLAFDLYPLLRAEDWLERFEGHSVYRETRAQELVESLWAHPASPWHNRINMLGESGQGPTVSQAAWIRSLLATYVKRWEGEERLGGLFGAPPKGHEIVLGWTRAQQAAFLILVGENLRRAVADYKGAWATSLRKVEPKQLALPMDVVDGGDPAFLGKYSLISTDQGIRGILAVTNDLTYWLAKDLKLGSLEATRGTAATDEAAVDDELKKLRKTPVAQFIRELTEAMASYDWRTSSVPDLSDDVRRKQMVFKGSSGYKELRDQLLKHLATKGGKVGPAAAAVAKALGY